MLPGGEAAENCGGWAGPPEAAGEEGEDEDV